MFLLWPTILLLYSGGAIALKQQALKSIASGNQPSLHFEPQVALLCDQKSGQMYYNQYMSESGHWSSDINSAVGNTQSTSCSNEKLDILEYCKKVYPTRDITNIVEASHYVKIGNWCKVGRSKCKRTEWVKPYRCLEGPFQSDALLVPEKCVFDHIHNQSHCWPFDRWNQTASGACQERGMNLRSFAMLLPCGISLFSGVEFVCCPIKEQMTAKKLQIANTMSDEFNIDNDTDDEDDEDDEDDLDDNDDDYGQYDDTNSVSSSTRASTTTKLTTTIATSTITTSTTPDPYFTHFDPHEEHKAYKEAQMRLEEVHREKVTKVMKDWSDLEERYQVMRQKDPHAAEEFKHRMTSRFQQTVQALEEEEAAEKHQLVAMHQQRINAHINQRKKDAMNCYTRALNDDSPNTHRVQKCLQKLLRSLHKDRHHTITHYRHLLMTSVEQAEREKAITLEHLVDIDHMVNQSLQMLERYPSISEKISKLMFDYVQALRSKDETPGSLPAMTKEAEAAILDKYKDEIIAAQEDKERERVLEKQRKDSMKYDKVEIRGDEAHSDEVQAEFDAETVIDDRRTTLQPSSPTPLTNTVPSMMVEHHDTQPRVARILSHDLAHGEPIYAIKTESYTRGPKNLYFTLAFTAFTLMAATLIGIAVVRRRNARLPQNQGFIEVDQAITPEERHVANMQINGYENPTYKYFEVKE